MRWCMPTDPAPPTHGPPHNPAVPQASLPESPRWLLLSGASRDAAAAALVRAEGRRAADPAVVAAELDSIAAAGAAGSGGGLRELLGEARFRRPLLIGSSLMLFQQAGGPCWALAGREATEGWNMQPALLHVPCCLLPAEACHCRQT